MGRLWDPILAKDKKGHLQKIMDEVVDGEMQNFKASKAVLIQEKTFSANILSFKIGKGLNR